MKHAYLITVLDEEMAQFKPQFKNFFILIGGLILAGILAAIDFMTPLGIASGTNYVLLILAISFTRNVKFVLFFSLVSLGLVLLGIYTSEHTVSNPVIFLTNRITSFIIVSAVAAMAIGLILSRKKLTQSYQNAFSIIEACPQGLLLINNKGIIEFSNTQAEKSFGYKSTELTGRHVDCLVPSSFKQENKIFQIAYFENPKSIKLGLKQTLYAVKKNKSTFPIEIGLNPVQINSQYKVICALTDITDRKQKEFEIAALYKKLKNSNEELEEFSQVAAGELHSKMNHIYQTICTFNKATLSSMNEQASLQLKEISQQLKELLQEMNQLFIYSKVSSRKTHLESVDLNDIVAQASELITKNNPSKQPRIQVLNELPEVYADRKGMVEVFSHLLHNAVLYNKEATPEIRIGILSAAIDENNPNSASAMQSKHNSIIYIQDNGVGFNEKSKYEIFKLFKRLEESESYGAGAGVGLSIVKKILEKQNHHIWVESNPKQGSTFFISF